VLQVWYKALTQDCLDIAPNTGSGISSRAGARGPAEPYGPMPDVA
jgi:hypothetical protein